MGINEKRGKRILILGNGFDLAHNLPTKYSNFLDFCKIVDKFFKDDIDIFGNWYIDDDIENIKIKRKDRFEKYCLEPLRKKRFSNIDFIYEDFCHAIDKAWLEENHNYYLSNIYDSIKSNIWYHYLDYMYSNDTIKGDNWIDFETEICQVIKEIDQMKLSITDSWEVISENIDNSMSDKLVRFGNLFDSKFNQYHPNTVFKSRSQFTLRDFIKEIYSELEELIYALDLYMSNIVEKIEIQKKIPEIVSINPDYIINFNYTHTYENVYEKTNPENRDDTNEDIIRNSKVFHIHGETNLNRHKNKDSNIVLGIDEYWSDEEKDKHTNFTIFKKFAQRIQKKTGDNIYRYLEEIKGIGSNINRYTNMSDDKNNNYVSKVYVFGHSLDITDKDIISEFIGNDATSVRIFCRSKQSEGELIAKTINLIGEDKLIEKSYRKIANLEYIILNNND